MPFVAEWSRRTRAAHNKHLREAAQHSQDSIKAAKSIVANVAKMHTRALAIGAAALGSKAPKPKRVDRRDLVGMLTNMNAQAWAIAKSGPRKLTAAEIRRHHKNLQANIPEYARNAAWARLMAKHWTSVTIHLQAIADMYKKHR